MKFAAMVMSVGLALGFALGMIGGAVPSLRVLSVCSLAVTISLINIVASIRLIRKEKTDA